MLATIVSVALFAMTPVTTGQGPELPPLFGGGGPDAYGYRWLDSDTTAPGAPTYTWIDIKGVGTRVTGLGDDNVVGPFDLGFDFPYYWYVVTSFYLGSNGYIAFHDNSLDAPDFNPVPGIARPNNTLAAFMADMEPSPLGSPNGSVWYWTNAANDTCIVQYDSIRFWRTGGGDGNNTYQIIISLPDSSITFQYKEQSGTPSNGWLPVSNQCGIENVSGQIGLNYLSGNTPIENMYHPELAVRFFPPESTSMEIHDAGIEYAMNDRSGGIFVLNNQPVELWGVAKNYGNQTEPDFRCYVNVKRGAVSQHYDSTTVSVPNPGDTDSVSFSSWTPSANGVYTIEVFTVLPGDAVPTNDRRIIETRVVTYPAILTYDNGNLQTMQYYRWNGPGGYGNRFVPPAYPCSIAGIRMASSYYVTPAVCAFAILDDNGAGGGPGDTLYMTTVNVNSTTPTWYTGTPSPPVVVDEGAFFVGAMSAVESEPQFGMDSIPPLSGQSWEYTGVWAPSRDMWARDAAFNATIVSTGIEEELRPAPAQPHLTVSPNPFGTSARLRLVNPRTTDQTAGVYDAAGTLVRTLELERGEAVFDGRDLEGRMLSEGIYFVRLVDDDPQVTKLVIAR
ncbi:MAG: T9SS type A sorting domain-containing protein [candidate division WOR-3 bacterium]|nr:MAG: T9SS type A sorting domain-containing protein [candidate division WOR-3 bacterium]